MQRAFFSNLVLLILLNVLIKPLWILGIEVSVQRILGPTVYGNYFALLNFAFLFTVLIDFGLNSFNNRQVARNPERMAEHLSRSGSLKLILGLIFLLVVQFVAWVMGFSAAETAMLWPIGLMLVLQSFLLFLRSNISGIQWYRADVIISVLDRSISIILAAILIWGGIGGLELTITRFIAIQIIAYSITILIALILLYSKGGRFRMHLRFGPMMDLLKKSTPYALLVLLVMSYFKIDAVMIKQLLSDGDNQAGIYAQGYKLLEASIMLAYLTSTLLLPMFSRMIKKKADVTSLVRLADQVLMVPVAILAVGAAMYRQDIMSLLYAEGTAESASVFHFLMLALIPIASSYIYGTLITAKGDLKKLNKIAALGVIINVIGNAVMIPKYGIQGAAIMTLITQSLVCFSQVVIAHRMFAIPFGRSQLLRGLALLIGLPLISRTIVEFFTDWRLEFIIFILVSLLFAMAIGSFSIKKMSELMKLRESMSAEEE